MIADTFNRLALVCADRDLGLDAEIKVVSDREGIPLPMDTTVYGLNAPVSLDTVNTPALVLTPVRVSAPQSASQGRRDSTHTLGIEWVTANPNEAEARSHSMYVAEALMRILDRFNAANTAYVGDSCVILTQGWRVEFVTWQQAPNTLRGFFLETPILARDIF